MTREKVSYPARVRITGGSKNVLMRPLSRLVFISLLAAQATPNTVWAQVKSAPPLSGVIGKVQSVTDSSVEVQTPSGVVHIDVKQPLTTYKQIPSDLSHVTSTSYVGVASTEQADGKEVAKQIIIFPEELRGAAEGSVLTDPPGATAHSSMTNGSVSRTPASHSRMTNGTVQKGSGTTLVVQYPDGSKTISVPANVPVVQVAPEPQAFLAERPLPVIEMTPRRLRYLTRRDVLLFSVGAVAALAGGGFLLPKDMLSRLGVGGNMDSPGKEWFLNKALRIDDDVAEALYSGNRRVPTYTKSQITPLKNNYNGATPDPGYISGWNLTLDGLASGISISLDIRNLTTRFSVREQITRLVCVEGWSAIAWWAGLRFDDLLRAYPPMSQAKWARVESSVNLDALGNPDPYFVSIDLATARHPQTLLATHFNGRPLTVDHGAPLRLLVPVKLGLKSAKAITKITYSAQEPSDYWAERGYSRYDGI